MTMSMTSGPTRVADLMEVPLEHRHVVCPTHGEPFRAKWPLGWDRFGPAIAMRALASPALQTGLADPAFWKHRGLLWGDLPAPVGVAMVQQLLADRPACEWVEPATLMGAYRRSGIGILGLCRLCGTVALGTPYGVISGRGRDVIPHLCFGCVVSGRIRA